MPNDLTTRKMLDAKMALLNTRQGRPLTQSKGHLFYDESIVGPKFQLRELTGENGESTPLIFGLTGQWMTPDMFLAVLDMLLAWPARWDNLNSKGN